MPSAAALRLRPDLLRDLVRCLLLGLRERLPRGLDLRCRFALAGLCDLPSSACPLRLADPDLKGSERVEWQVHSLFIAV